MNIHFRRYIAALVLIASSQGLHAAEKAKPADIECGILTPEQYKNRAKPVLTQEEELYANRPTSGTPTKDDKELDALAKALNAYAKQAQIIGTGHFLQVYFE